MSVYMNTVKWLLDRTNLTQFEKDVLIEISKTKPGETLTYSELAAKLGKPNAARAVGNALHKNPYIIFVPCHRVTANGKIGGYGRGVLMKRILLSVEGSPAARAPA